MKLSNLQNFISSKIISGQVNKKLVLEFILEDYLTKTIPLLYLEEDLEGVFEDISVIQQKLINLKTSL